MSDRFFEILKVLRDVDGVIGSFIWTTGGTLLATDLPEVLQASVLAEVGPRIERLNDAFQSGGDRLEIATLAFAQHKLHVRPFGGGFVAVLSAIEINMPTLKMALSLVGRRVSVELAQQTTAAANASRQEPAAEPDAAARASGWKRIYRGNLVRS